MRQEGRLVTMRVYIYFIVQRFRAAERFLEKISTAAAANDDDPISPLVNFQTISRTFVNRLCRVLTIRFFPRSDNISIVLLLV